MGDTREVYDFYNAGAEIGRLESGLGKIELYRTKEILKKYIEGEETIYDVGGGIGIYSAWLAMQGCRVTLIDLAENAVAYAKAHMMKECTFSAETGDARKLAKPDCSADVVLLMGPLYHLQETDDRMSALREAHRVLKRGGLLIAAGISKYSSAIWALANYGVKNDFIDDPVFFAMLRDEILSGNHNRPREYPNLIAQAYFTTSGSMEREVEDAGFSVMSTHAVEGCIRCTPLLAEKWEDAGSRERLLQIVRMTEHDPELMGMSPHFMVVARK